MKMPKSDHHQISRYHTSPSTSNELMSCRYDGRRLYILYCSS